MNMQNWPHELMKYLLADEGYVLYIPDKSQIENRIVAYVGNVIQMIEAFESDVDVHSLTAALIFGKPLNEVSDEPESSELGGGRFSERFWGKKANHALNYDMSYKTFALKYEIPETQAKWVVERYHLAYPGVRQNYHEMVKAQLGKDRTLTNLFGRKTLFLDQWGDKLWKVGYSCIPQGTTGDLINEYGLNYIYYNQTDFRPVELLGQFHDAIAFQIEVPSGINIPGYKGRRPSWEEHAGMLRLIQAKLDTPLKWRDREFVVPTEITMGLSFYKEEGIKIKTINAETLKGAYEKLCRNETSRTGSTGS